VVEDAERPVPVEPDRVVHERVVEARGVRRARSLDGSVSYGGASPADGGERLSRGDFRRSSGRCQRRRSMGVSSLMNDIELACLLLPRGKG
jgi:hypothetical protein